MHITAQLNTALAGRYTIEREIGQGGMATVYLARDARHNRSVALKVLKPDIGAFVGIERFLSEIQVTANLQHPNLLPLFDSGEANGMLFYVMPYVEGETLRARLDREKQLPVEDALHIATAIASALDYAHRRGVIHRDLKPENILMHEGQPLVADFGIALAVSNAGGKRITETGLSLGTPQYMSPEQATGDRTIDARTDIYSLGAVVYEMLVGEPPHSGSTSQAIIARVLTEKPRSVRASRSSVAVHVEEAVEHALEKLPADRWATAREFSDALAGSRSVIVQTRQAGDPARVALGHGWDRRSKALLTTCVVLAASLVGVFLGNGRRSAIGPAIYDVGLPDSAPISFTGGSPWGEGTTALAISPAGQFVVYVAARDSGTELWYRSLLDTTAHPISGTAGAYHPMLSPDAKHVAYFSGKRLMVSPIAGGSAVNVGEVDRPRGGEWSTPIQILVADANGRLLRGFDPTTRKSRVAMNGLCILPRVLANGDVLCGRRTAVSRSFTDTARRPFLIGPADAHGSVEQLNGSHFLPFEHSRLIFMGVDASISGTMVDFATHQAGRPVVLVRGVRREGFDMPGQFALAASGTLVFVPGENVEIAKFALISEGKLPVELAIPAAAHQRFDVSRDGRRLASAIHAVDGMELWVYDIATGRGDRWIRADYIGEPRWSPDGERLIVDVRATPQSPNVTLVGSPSSTSQPDTLFRSGRYFSPTQFYAESLVLGQLRQADESQPEHVDLRVRPPRVDSLRRGETLSPDGRWLAHTTSQAGGIEIYVESFPSDGKRYRASPSGGVEPLWLAPGRLVFRSGTSWYEVAVSSSRVDPVGTPRLLFGDPRFIDTDYRSNAMMPGGSMVYVRGGSRASGAFLRVMPRFGDEIRRRVR
jgi:eukaryotic-like serine/threonine-protein kinase